MANMNPARALTSVNRLRRSFGENDTKLYEALKLLAKSRISDADSLIQFHEALLFFRAYPPSTRILLQVEDILKSFDDRVSRLIEADADVSAFDDPEVSGIVAGSVTTNFSYAIVRWLAARFARRLSIDWDWFEEEDLFGVTMSRFLPLLEDDAMVEAHVPFRAWLDAARGRTEEIAWIIRQFESLQISNKRKSELYDALKLNVTWRFGAGASRTLMRHPIRKAFIHDQPLIQRRDISLVAEVLAPPIPVKRLSLAEGQKILDLARETSAVRYRELHGFTYGDARGVLKAELGRGNEVFVMGVPPERRLPLRAYHAALIFKNGVPVAYFEGLSICERMESGFNLYYTFRDGETAWLYARILRLMRQLLGVTVFSIDPYQVGHENDEGIESGAFWFYRKLGFRPVKRELLKLTESEERKMAENPRHRTSRHVLKKLASGHMLFELPGIKTSKQWDRFQVRNIGLAVQRRMAGGFAGNAKKSRDYSLRFITRLLSLNPQSWNEHQITALENLSLVLAMIPSISKWDSLDKELAEAIIRAKGSRSEAHYLKLMQKHAALRNTLIRLGSK
jgi:hypothetical protein